MNCSDFQNLMFEFAEESLPPETRAAAEAHLAQCAACREALHRERQFAQALSGHLQAAAEKVSLAAVSRARILDALEETAAPRRFIALWPMGIAAGLALLGAIVLNRRPAHPKPGISVQVSYIVPVPGFHQEGNQIIDTVSDETVTASATLPADAGKPGKYEER